MRWHDNHDQYASLDRRDLPEFPLGHTACTKKRGRILVNEYMEVSEWPCVWALGVWAVVPDRKTGESHPLTAQHALREGKVAAQNILATIRGDQKKPFLYSTIGWLAPIGKRTGVANILGVNFSGFIAWWLWRTIYLLKLPRFEKKVLVALDWTLDVFSSKDLVHFRTTRPPTLPLAEEESESEPVQVSGC